MWGCRGLRHKNRIKIVRFLEVSRFKQKTASAFEGYRTSIKSDSNNRPSKHRHRFYNSKQPLFSICLLLHRWTSFSSNARSYWLVRARMVCDSREF